MTRAKKCLLIGFIVLLVLLLAAFLVGNWLLDSVSREALAKLSQRAEREGVVVEDPNFDRARIAGIRTARWTGIGTRLQFPESDAFAPNRIFDVHVGQADLWLAGGGQVVLEARDLAVDASDASATVSGELTGSTGKEKIRAERFRCQFPLDPFHPLSSLEQTLPQLIALMHAGASSLPIEAEGTLEFVVKGAPIKSRLKVSQVDGGQTLVLDSQDLRPVSALFNEALTEAELELIATYPLRVAPLLRIKDDAETTSSTAKTNDDQVPEDAYRHVLWSFLLTREYGPEFAERVTNAHEAGDTGNTPGERKMDLNNNGVGRSWARENVSRDEILARVLGDPAVIREPR